MLVYLRQLTAERDSLTAAATSLADTAAGESRDLTDTERASLATMQERCAAIDSQLTTYGAQVDATRAYAALRGRLSETTDDGSHAPAGALATRGAQTPEHWTDPLIAKLSGSGYNGRGSLELGEAPLLFERAPVMVEGFPGTIPPYYFKPTPWKMATPLLDVCGRVTVSSNSVEWYTWPAMFPEAPVVPEGQAKPEIDFPPTPHSASLQTYAHHKPLSRQALEDVPQIQSIIEGALRGGVFRSLEAGVIAALAAASAAGGIIPTVDGADMLYATRLGLATVQTAGYTVANAVIMNPLDFAALDVRVMEETVTGPIPTTRVWGLPVLVSADVVQGESWVGDFSTGVTVFARNAMGVFMSDSHADYFVKNLLVILAEQRALPAVTAGGAICKCTATAIPGTAAASTAPAPRERR
jgi:hypothetical protein